jgi:hypothetical protein
VSSYAELEKRNEILVNEIDDVVTKLDILRAGIRKHRDQKGDDRCWMDDEELYKLLPEGYEAPVRDSSVELKQCELYIKCRHNPGTEYVSPQRRIEELEARVRELEDEVSEERRDANYYRELYYDSSSRGYDG